MYKKHGRNINKFITLYVCRAEDGPTCIVIQALGEDTRKSRFTWLVNVDLKVNLLVI